MAVLSSSVILGGSLLSISESGRNLAAAFTATQQIFNEEMPTLVFVSPVFSDMLATPSAFFSATPSPTLTPRENCPLPEGWMAYVVPVGDTTENIAKSYGITVEELAEKNCWDTIFSTVFAGTSLYVPASSETPSPTPPPSRTPVPTPTYCVHPYGWLPYTIRSGDTLFSIARAVGVSALELQRANCLSNPNLIHGGDILWVPQLPQFPTPKPSSTPAPTRTPAPTTPFRSPTPTHTPTPTQVVPPSNTPTETTEPTLPVHPPTDTPVPPPSASPYPAPIGPSTTGSIFNSITPV
jgi:LysM repeat protein